MEGPFPTAFWRDGRYYARPGSCLAACCHSCAILPAPPHLPGLPAIVTTCHMGCRYRHRPATYTRAPHCLDY